VIDEQHAVQVVDLVLQAGRQQPSASIWRFAPSASVYRTVTYAGGDVGAWARSDRQPSSRVAAFRCAPPPPG
jgi:hypothetical protein